MIDNSQSSNKVTFYLARMAARGFSSEQVLAGTGLQLEEVGGDQFRPGPDHYRGIIRNMLHLTGDPFIGIAMGSEFKISELGVLGYAALSSSNLTQSRELFTKYDALVEHILTPTTEVAGGKWVTELVESFPLGEILPFAVEEFISRTKGLASSLTNQPFPVLELRLSYAQPEDLTAYSECFDCPIFFKQPRNLVVWDIEHLEDPISLANREVFKLCEQQCQMLVNRLADESLLSSNIRDALVKFPGEFPSLEQMARRLKMGSRTLRRRLVKENLTYQQILDDTRKGLAIQYLEYTSLTPKEIGFLLGYNSVSNFRRAFKGWTGKKLTDYRQNA
jgi:AraC-like DNA-binding protein